MDAPTRGTISEEAPLGPAAEQTDDESSPYSRSWKLKLAVILLVILISIAFAGLIWSMIL